MFGFLSGLLIHWCTGFSAVHEGFNQLIRQKDKYYIIILLKYNVAASGDKQLMISRKCKKLTFVFSIFLTILKSATIITDTKKEYQATVWHKLLVLAYTQLVVLLHVHKC